MGGAVALLRCAKERSLMAGNLRVLIDARMMLGRFSGVARMVTRLIETLLAVPNVRVVALCGNEPYEPWANHTDLEMIVSDFSRKDRSPTRRLWWEATRLRLWIAQSGADVFHPRAGGLRPVPTVLTFTTSFLNEPVRNIGALPECAIDTT
jgi:hypothetical protein